MKKISVIVPMYNVAQYLQKCVDSVLQQNVGHEEIEIIMVNDESPDNSLEIANQLAEEHSCIKVVSQKNKGLGGARNTGVSNATGEYIVFLDADDWLVQNSLDKLLKLASDNNLDILEFGANLVNEDGEITSTVATNSEGKLYTGVTYYNTIKYSGSACNKLYSRLFWERHNLAFLEQIYGEDFEFNTRSFFYAQRVMATEIIGAEFLQTFNSITRNSDRSKKDKYARDYITILTSIRDFFETHRDDENKEIIKFFTERLTMVNVNAFYLLFKNNYSFREITNYRRTLRKNGLLFITHEIANKKKNLFRKIMINNSYLFRFSQPIKKLLKITG
ncbi:glycosyltransferase family 2 protein [Aquimarina sp. 2201CG5-10]|uniref:glycosyltransferase family 2 protein n=1 Tax=Aquimarina callyspongiae TaxID=3098150 RepID=UPI002AB398EF|nr:glycosyltransferase [Aquimarina sp. 2201CG5-10]MDY8136293.1 glycosyltransferase [Aquimarina sp. 2201CG5-10]